MARAPAKLAAPKGDADASLSARTVASAPAVVTPEAPTVGTWDAFAVLRDPGAPAAVERGEYDRVVDELHGYVVRHGSDALRLALEARAVAISHQLEGAPELQSAPPSPAPFKASSLRRG